MELSVKRGKKFKKAGISIEFVLATVLALVVIFSVLGLFSKNLKTMVANSNFNNLLHKQHATDYDHKNMDYSVAQKNLEQNVQIVAEQGMTVAQYHAQAMATINAIAQLPQPLSDTDKINLAKALTIYVESGTKDARSMIYEPLTVSVQGKPQDYNYRTLGTDNGIYISYSGPNYSTTVQNDPKSPYQWGKGNPNIDAAAPSADEKTIRIPNIVFIINKFDNPN